MKKKDFYLGVFIIVISLHILGFIVSPHNFESFSTYLDFSPAISSTFYIPAIILFCIVLWDILRLFFGTNEDDN